MSQSAYSVSGAAALTLATRVDCGRPTSAGGLPWRERVEQTIGLCRGRAADFGLSRDRSLRGRFMPGEKEEQRDA